MAVLDYQRQLLRAAQVACEGDMNSVKWYDSFSTQSESMLSRSFL
ncbi:hypothetical protein [Phormidesmis sp. 146-33]